MSLGSTTLSTGGSITDQQIAAAKQIAKEYEVQKQKGKVTDELFKKAAEANLLLNFSIAKRTKDIEAAQQRQAVLKAQQEQDKTKFNALTVQNQQAKTTLSGLNVQNQQERAALDSKLRALLANIDQRVVKLQRPATTAVQSLQQNVADCIAKNSRGEKVDFLMLQNQYKAAFAQ